MSVIRDDYEQRKISYEKPENIHSLDNNEHWRKYLEYLTTTEYSESRERTADQREQSQNFSEYLCRAWNERHAREESLRSLEVVFMREKPLPDYKALRAGVHDPPVTHLRPMTKSSLDRVSSR